MTDPTKENKVIPPSQRTSYGNKEGAIHITIGFVTLIASIIIYWIFYKNFGIEIPKFETKFDRFEYAVKLQFWPMIVLGKHIFQVQSTSHNSEEVRPLLKGYYYRLLRNASIFFRVTGSCL